MLSCNPVGNDFEEQEQKSRPESAPFTNFSELVNTYKGFNSPKAINHMVKIENEYFQQYDLGGNRYYGTIWRTIAESKEPDDIGPSLYEKFQDEWGNKVDSMHCTIYAVEALRAGMGDSFKELEQSHKRIWGNREHAGWSIGHLLVKEWNWKAYLVIDRNSEEFGHCLRFYQRNKEYPVWRQPNIPLKKMLIIGEDDDAIQNLLKENEFGWGFSHQGIHTWFTRFDELKECNWQGAPGKKYEIWPTPLFLKTPFLDYKDYASHILIFPPKMKAD